ncbi:hypothetical protein DXG01_012634 [Tephrocybe rancida]|nr:hypothetical protein DXG01_012634 [Tephrocybe rancida]
MNQYLEGPPMNDIGYNDSRSVNDTLTTNYSLLSQAVLFTQVLYEDATETHPLENSDGHGTPSEDSGMPLWKAEFETGDDFANIHTQSQEVKGSEQQHHSPQIFPEMDDYGPLSPLSDIESDLDSLSLLYPSDEEDGMWEEQEREFKNPSKSFKIKIPHEAAEVGLGSCLRRVGASGITPFPVDLPQDLLDFTVPRRFTSDVYGGSLELVFPKIGKDKRALHPWRGFMFINHDLNPYAPQRAGHPGLFYRTGQDVVLKEYRFFIRVQCANRNVWLYLGQYELVPSTPLTPEEWVANKDKTKETWMKRVITVEDYLHIRVRISLRKTLGREPTAEEVDECDGSGITLEDIRLAYDKGEERILVWVMKCVGYDEAFQREMQEKFAVWVPPPPKKNSEDAHKKKIKNSRKHSTAVSQPVTKKRKTDHRPTPATVEV